MARYLARKLHRFIVFDPKVKLDIKAWNLVDATPTGLRNFERGDSLRLRLTPPIESPGQFWIENAQRIFESGECVLYIDEVYLIVPPGTRADDHLLALWTQGRGQNIGVWASAQRPSWTPLVMISEAEHWFVFRLTLIEDRQRMREFMGDAVLSIIKDRHGFFYKSIDDDEPHYFPELNASPAIHNGKGV